jgi:formylglycine-generating enzyme required for sulfatase activity
MKTRTRLFLPIALLVLLLIACNLPFLNRSLPALSDLVNGQGSSPFAPTNTDGAEVIYIPAATFQMGSETSDLQAEEDEFPQHQVSINGFYIYTHEVTNRMYLDCVADGACMPVQALDDTSLYHIEDPAYGEHPVVGADWVMARSYCQWAGARLPTEAEWELASRGPDSLLYPWGNETPSCSRVNMDGCLIPSDTQEVGHYRLGNSPEGVWDLSGNVWEWVQDWYGEDYYQHSPEDNPLGPSQPQDPDHPLRVIRGGGFHSDPDKMRSASRKGLNPYRDFIDVGFRCVTGQDLLFPENYDHGSDRHERVPPDSADGGDSADDSDGYDDPTFWAEEALGSCPDERGIFYFNLHAGASVPVSGVEVSFPGILAEVTCRSRGFDRYDCSSSTTPPEYLVIPPPSIPMRVCLELGDGSGSHCLPPIPLWKPSDCDEEDIDFGLDVIPSCLDSATPVIAIRVRPAEFVFERAWTPDVDLTCETLPEPGMYMCRGLPGSPGDSHLIYVTVYDGRLHHVIPVEVEHPDCEHSGGLNVRTHCLEIEGTLTPVLIVQIFDHPAAFSSASANGIDLVCETLAGAIYSCTGLSGLPGDPLTIDVHFDSGPSYRTILDYPDCGGPDDFSLPWELAEVGCLYPSGAPPEYYAVIDTFLEVEFLGYRLEDVSAPWTCEEIPDTTGRWFCNFAIADWYTDLIFCATWVGSGDEHCQTFPDLGTRLPDSCPVSEDDSGGDECRQWDTFNECVSHGCTWDASGCHR